MGLGEKGWGSKDSGDKGWGAAGWDKGAGGGSSDRKVTSEELEATKALLRRA